MWRPDGWNTTLRLGIITPDVDLNPESEIRAMAPTDIGLHAARARFAVEAHPTVTMPLSAVRAFAAPPNVDEAVEQLAAAPLDTIAFAFTSTTYLLGARGDEAMLRRLRERACAPPTLPYPPSPATAACSPQTTDSTPRSHNPSPARLDSPYRRRRWIQWGRDMLSAAPDLGAPPGPCAAPTRIRQPHTMPTSPGHASLHVRPSTQPAQEQAEPEVLTESDEAAVGAWEYPTAAGVRDGQPASGASLAVRTSSRLSAPRRRSSSH